MPTTPKRHASPPVPAPESRLLTPYRVYVPPLAGAPLPTFCHCRCGLLLVEQIWHGSTEEVEAHWELCDPPVTAVLGEAHTEEACARRLREAQAPSAVCGTARAPALDAGSVKVLRSTSIAE